MNPLKRLDELPVGFRLTAAGEDVEVLAGCSEEKDEKKKYPTFKMTAYTGAVMNVGWGAPVVVDLQGIKWTNKARPILRDHNPSQIVGHTTKIEVAGGKLRVEGVISAGNAYATEVVVSAGAGFPWQASIGARARGDRKNSIKILEEGEEEEVNGQKVVGPAYILKKSVLGEVSFVPLGADDETSASVAASADDAEGLEAERTKESNMENPVQGSGAPVINAGLTLEQVRAEQARAAEIQVKCQKYPEIVAKAIAEGWSVDKAELHALKAGQVQTEQDSKVAAPAVHVVDQKVDAGALKAAACAQQGMSEENLVKAFGAESVEKSVKMRRMGLRAAMAACFAKDGITVPSLHASNDEWARAAFSSVSFTDLLSDSANKTLLAAYAAVPSVARIVAKALSARDFKVHKSVRLTGDQTFLKVENGGEIKHGTLGDDSYTFSVDTYGRMIGLTRQDMVNDDLGAFLEIPGRFGRGAALAVEQLFWALVIANTGSFFSAANGNYIEGTTTALSITGLSLAEKAMMEQSDSDGNPINVEAKYLVVPPALSATARQLYVSTDLTGGSSATLTKNIYAGKYQPLTTPYLKAPARALEWYLFADPQAVPAFGIAWLNGVQVPTVEEVTAGPEYLGRVWRGYIDFGVCQIDPKGAVFSEGEDVS